ncbi:hypothetical protein QFZ37_003908 [Chryseobacterium ginsenosidimutans]|nr:hypothetical protein [Chryseobacterium ginsenosidimutans]
MRHAIPLSRRGGFFRRKKTGWLEKCRTSTPSLHANHKQKPIPHVKNPSSTSPTPTDTFRRSRNTFCIGSDTLYNLSRYVHQKPDGVFHASDGVIHTSGHFLQPVPTGKRYLRIGKRPLPTYAERIARSQQPLPTIKEHIPIAEKLLPTYKKRFGSSKELLLSIPQRINLH